VTLLLSGDGSKQRNIHVTTEKVTALTGKERISVVGIPRKNPLKPSLLYVLAMQSPIPL
jgi:hypothetical protein